MDYELRYGFIARIMGFGVWGLGIGVWNPSTRGDVDGMRLDLGWEE